MKKILFLLIFIITNTNAQVGINTTNPEASAALDIASSNKGLLIPRMTQSQRNAIHPTITANGLLVYQTDENTGFYYFNGIEWRRLEGVQGPQGIPGTNGKSAYEVYKVNNPNSGLSESEWLNSLQGTPGKDASESVPQIHLTHTFIPEHPKTMGRQYVAFVTAATSTTSYSGGTSPPAQVYAYKLIDARGNPTTEDPILKFPDNASKFPQEEPFLKTAPSSYGVVIVDGSEQAPNSPVKIDVWISDMVESIAPSGVFYNVLATEDSVPGIYTEQLYHFSWTASQEWIHKLWRENGGQYIGPRYPEGIPLLLSANQTIKP